MSHDRSSSALGLKRSSGWFAAGAEFRQALQLLSDGAFKLYVYLCLAAGRRTGRVEAGQQELAVAIRRSKRIVGRYVAELEAKGVCRVQSGRNQHSRTVIEIADAYWPYHRETPTLDARDGYVAVVRDAFLAVSCATGVFGANDEAIAKGLEARGVPVSLVEDAILVGTARKLVSLLNGAKGPLIASLRYFEPIIAELEEQPLAADYRTYLRRRTGELARVWKQSELLAKKGNQHGAGGSETR